MSAITFNTVHIESNTQRLGPVYQAGYVHFCVTLNASISFYDFAYTGAPATFLPHMPTRDELKPWNFLNLRHSRKVRIWYRKATSDPFAAWPTLIDVIDEPAALADANRIIDMANFQSHGIDPAATPLANGTYDGSNARASSHAVLASLLNLPSPVPAELGLALFVRLNEQNLRTVLGLQTTDPWPPQLEFLMMPRLRGAVDPAHDSPMSVEFTYPFPAAPGTEPWYRGKANPGRFAINDDPNSYFDTATLFLRPFSQSISGEQWFAEDWGSKLQQRFAAIMDMPRCILQAAQTHVAVSPSSLVALMPVWRAALLAASHDLADVHSAYATSVSLPSDMAIRAKLDSYSANLTLEAWIEVLRANLPTLAETPLLRSNGWSSPLDKELLDRELGEWAALIAALAEPGTLRALILHQAKAATLTLTQLTKLEEAWSDPISTNPSLRAPINLRGLQELGNIREGSWNTLLNFDTAIAINEAVKASLKAALAQYASDRVRRTSGTQPSPTSPFLRRRPLLPDSLAEGQVLQLRNILLTFVSTVYSDKMASELVPSNNLTHSSPVTVVPHPVSLPIDRPGVAHLAGSQDYSRSLTGYGLLVAPDNTPWSCLHLAKLKFVSPAGGVLDLSPIVVHPSTLPLTDGFGKFVIEYNNQPLGAESPLSKAEKNQPPPKPYSYQFPVVYSNETDWARLHWLRFDPAPLNFVPFAVPLGGALPKELADPTHPAKLAHSSHNVTIPAAYRRPVIYKRRVPISSFLVRYGNNADNQAPPALPPGVVSIHSEIRPTCTSAVDTKSDPLLLCPDSDYHFQLRPPSCDVQVYCRWKGYTQDALVHSLSLENNLDKDRAFDDPALSGVIFTAGLEALWSPNNVQVPGDVSFQFTNLDPFTSKWLDVKVSKGTPALTFQSNTLSIVVPHGVVWRLVIKGQTNDPQKFEIDPSYQRCEFALALETPMRTLPSALAVWEALDLRLANGRLTASIDLAKVTDPVERNKFAWVKRALLSQQTWNWDGRPLYPRLAQPPFALSAVSSGPVETALKWEVQGFGLREDSDRLDIPLSGAFLDRTSSSAWKLRNTAVPLHEIDVSSDSRALYHRFTLSLTNRYQEASSTDPNGQVSARGDKTIWKRIFVPCNWPHVRELPPPVFRLAIPVSTSNSKVGQRTPPLLLLFNDPGTELGGLAETIDVRVSETTVQHEVPSQNYTLPEFAPDPVRHPERWPRNQVAPTIEVEGPIGYTFDRATTDSFFANTGYLATLPQAPHLPWHFAKLELRRKLAAQQCADGQERLSRPLTISFQQFSEDVSPWNRSTVELIPGPPFKLSLLNSKSRQPETRILHTLNVNSKLEQVLWVLFQELVTDAITQDTSPKHHSLWNLDAASGVLTRLDGSSLIAGGDYKAVLITVLKRRDETLTGLTNLVPKEGQDFQTDGMGWLVSWSDSRDVVWRSPTP